MVEKRQHILSWPRYWELVEQKSRWKTMATEMAILNIMQLALIIYHLKEAHGG